MPGKTKLSGTISQLRWRAPLDEAGERALATAQPEHRVPGQHRALEQFDTHPLSGERVDRYQIAANSYAHLRYYPKVKYPFQLFTEGRLCHGVELMLPERSVIDLLINRTQMRELCTPVSKL
jgi:hypothetical protein